VHVNLKALNNLSLEKTMNKTFPNKKHKHSNAHEKHK